MTYYNPEKQIPVIVDSSRELFNAMESDKVKIQDLEKVWIDLFKQTERYNGQHVTECLRMLYESALVAFNEFSRKDFAKRQIEANLQKELSYE